jgi:glycosyltransferase involved in cell wall biosynthesis
MTKANRLLMVLPSVVRQVDGELEVEVDFCEDLRLYLESFTYVTLACPVITELKDSGLRRCRPIRELPWADRLKVIRLPAAYRPSKYLRVFRSVRSVLRSEIARSDVLLFAPYTLIGDWPLIAAWEARRLGRTYAIDADVVSEQVARVSWARKPAWKRFIKNKFELGLFQLVHRRALNYSNLGLLRGQDVFDAYSPFCSNPHKVYHMPVSRADYISRPELDKKVQSVAQGGPLRICYVGRAIEMKGPMDWVRVLHELNRSGVLFEATWFGDGSFLQAMHAEVTSCGLVDHVRFQGFSSDRDKIMAHLRGASLFLFCHKTPESPRCLIEALSSGCPIVGYASAFARDLVEKRGGGEFVAVNDWRGLAEVVKRLDAERNLLVKLIHDASASGQLFDRDHAMQQRIDLLLRYAPGTDRGIDRSTTYL